MADIVTPFGRSLVQHGSFSDRIYALKLDPSDMPDVLDDLEELAIREGYGKIIAKGRSSDAQEFLARGYLEEARVPFFFGPGEDGVFMGKFLNPARSKEPDPQRVTEVLEVALEEKREKGTEAGREEPEEGKGSLSIREADEGDLQSLASCYGAVFASYPFPIHDPDHLREEMMGGTRFFTAWEGSDLVAASSMEPGGAPGTVEMTDFATLPSHRGLGLATHLLGVMDEAAAEAGERVAYTIARAVSFGMNITFARRAYTFGGTLVSNTQIGGSIESMNIWYKVLQKP